ERGRADDLEGHVDAPGQDRLDRLADAAGRVGGVGGAETGGELELVGVGVEGDDRRGAGDARPLDHVQPDAAAPDDGDAVAGRHTGDVEHCAEPGRDPAPGEADELQRDGG